jgi:septin family protein
MDAHLLFDKFCSWLTIVDYLDARFCEYLETADMPATRPPNVVDGRVHACLYFVQPMPNIGFVH